MPTTLKQKIVLTKKDHYCHGCATKYPAKTSMEYLVEISSEEAFFTTYWCPQCVILRDKYHESSIEPVDGIAYGEIRDWSDFT